MTEQPTARQIVQRGLYFEEFDDDAVYHHRPGRTVTEADNVLFSALTMNQQALHLDEAWSAGQEFGGRLMNSMWTLATLVGLSVNQLTQGTIVANLGFTSVSFPHPVRAGDTLYAETKVLDRRLSRSRPGQGIVTLEHTGRNQDGLVVALAVRTVLMQCKDATQTPDAAQPPERHGPVMTDAAGGAPPGPGWTPPGPALLFCPADRPDRYAKAAAAADCVILDLEDAVAPADKARARDALAGSDLDPERTIVRLNPAGSADCVADLAALTTTRYRVVMLAKTESPADLQAVSSAEPGLRIVALCETARGVLHVESIAVTPEVVAVMWGAEDLMASMGGTSSRAADGGYRDVARHARSQVLLAAAAHGKAAIDAVHLDIADLAGLAQEAQDAAACGFAATACIHPGQVATVRAAYRPTDSRIDWARDLLAAAVREAGVFRFRGQMVDEPMLAQARAVLGRADSP